MATLVCFSAATLIKLLFETPDLVGVNSNYSFPTNVKSRDAISNNLSPTGVCSEAGADADGQSWPDEGRSVRQHDQRGAGGHGPQPGRPGAPGTPLPGSRQEGGASLARKFHFHAFVNIAAKVGARKKNRRGNYVIVADSFREYNGHGQSDKTKLQCKSFRQRFFYLMKNNN